MGVRTGGNGKMISCTRKLEFDSAHRILNHESKCRTLHGHRYTVEVTVCSEELDSLGRVVDFSEIKKMIGGWLDTNWDHNTILHKDDMLVDVLVKDAMAMKVPYVMAVNPTAENMADHLFELFCPCLKDKGMTLKKIKIYETPNCFAERT